MRKLAVTTGVFALLLNSAFATSYQWNPTDSDLADLDHHYAYEWRVDASSLRSELNNGWQIQSAQLTIYNIYDWQVSEKDMLFVHLLNATRTTKSTHAIADQSNDSNFTDFFAGNPLIRVDSAFDYAIGAPDYASATDGIYQDPNGSRTKETITYTFSSELLGTLTGYVLNDGIFGIGADPDCHYYNTGVDFKVNTARVSVPDGGLTLALLGMGLFSLGAIRYKVS